MRAGPPALLFCSLLPGMAAWAADGPPCVSMVFNPDNSVVLNGRAVDLASLPARLAEIARRDPRPRLCLLASSQSNHAEIEAAMGVIRKSGLTVNMAGTQARP